MRLYFLNEHNLTGFYQRTISVAACPPSLLVLRKEC